MTKISVVGRVPGLNALPPSMAPICTVGSINWMRIFALVLLFPILNRLRHLACGEHKFCRLAVHADARPEQSGVADLQLQSGGLADDAHVRHHAMVHQVARADAGAAISLALKAPDLRFFDLADDAGNDQIAS